MRRSFLPEICPDPVTAIAFQNGNDRDRAQYYGDKRSYERLLLPAFLHKIYINFYI
jgi:hypothetical protein